MRPELSNWAVLETEAEAGARPRARRNTPPPIGDDFSDAPVIEGTAQVVEQSAPAPGPNPAPGSSAEPANEGAAPGGDQIDPILIAGLPHREVMVQPGGKATLVVSLLNNGPEAATFVAHLEGWAHESWLEGEAQRSLVVQPGERAALPIVIAPPRDGSVTAGTFQLMVVLRSPQHPRRRTRLAASLVVTPFTEFAMGRLEPAAAALDAFRRSAHFALPVTNLGNHPLQLALQGQVLGLPGLVEFTETPGEESRVGGRGTSWLASPATLHLEPRQTAELFVRATVKGAPVLAARALQGAVRVSAATVVLPGAEEYRRLPRSTAAEIVYRPPLRPWHLITAVIASFLLLVGFGVLALAARLLLGGLVAAPEQLPAGVAAPAPIVIVLSQNAPVAGAAPAFVPAPSSDPAVPNPSTAMQPALAAAAEGTLTPQAGVDARVPLVQPNQITGPDERAPAAQAALQGTGGLIAADAVSQPGQAAPAAAPPVPAAQPARQMTYAEMFRDVALQYDLDWRLLAAQAYVESGFDSLALGSDGDMGLMQVLPSTWREWAPAVNASDPFDAYSNALVAAAYHDYLRAQLGKRGLPQAQWMLVAYNWGIDRLGDHLDAGGTWETLPPVRRGYAEDILRIARTIP